MLSNTNSYKQCRVTLEQYVDSCFSLVPRRYNVSLSQGMQHTYQTIHLLIAGNDQAVGGQNWITY